jgi:hypothetical protein
MKSQILKSKTVKYHQYYKILKNTMMISLVNCWPASGMFFPLHFFVACSAYPVLLSYVIVIKLLLYYWLVVQYKEQCCHSTLDSQTHLIVSVPFCTPFHLRQRILPGQDAMVTHRTISCTGMSRTSPSEILYILCLT